MVSVPFFFFCLLLCAIPISKMTVKKLNKTKLFPGGFILGCQSPATSDLLDFPAGSGLPGDTACCCASAPSWCLLGLKVRGSRSKVPAWPSKMGVSTFKKDGDEKKGSQARRGRTLQTHSRRPKAIELPQLQ